MCKRISTAFLQRLTSHLPYRGSFHSGPGDRVTAVLRPGGGYRLRNCSSVAFMKLETIDAFSVCTVAPIAVVLVNSFVGNVAAISVSNTRSPMSKSGQVYGGSLSAWKRNSVGNWGDLYRALSILRFIFRCCIFFSACEIGLGSATH